MSDITLLAAMLTAEAAVPLALCSAGPARPLPSDIFASGEGSSLWVFARARGNDATPARRNFDRKTTYFTRDKDMQLSPW